MTTPKPRVTARYSMPLQGWLYRITLSDHPDDFRESFNYYPTRTEALRAGRQEARHHGI